jgi:hypothetical protein
MNVKEQLCAAFCNALSIRELASGGFAIGTDYDGLSGNPVGIYVLGPDEDGAYRIQDDGITIPTLESIGADFENKTRLAAFNELLDAYGVQFDDVSGDLRTKNLAEAEVAHAALGFLAFMLRVQDLALMSVERAKSTFIEDATKELRSIIGDRAQLVRGFVVDQSLDEFPADLGILAEGRPPVALFWGTSDSKVYEALLLKAYAQANLVECAVVTLLEQAKSVTQKMLQRASNHLDANPIFMGQAHQACARIARQALGFDPDQKAVRPH